MIYHWDNEPLSLHAQIHIAPGPDMAAVAPVHFQLDPKLPKLQEWRGLAMHPTSAPPQPCVLLLVPRAVDVLITRRAGRNPRVFLIVMSRFAWHLQYIHVFPQIEAFADQLCFPWRKNDYEVWHAWVFSFAEGLSCANQHVPTLEVTSE